MRLNIDPDSGVPVYLQIVQGVKRSIALGSLREGEQLPSVREVAEQLTVNPNTVAKAYRNLEREGVVDTRKGVGTFVTDGELDLPDQERREIVREMIERAIVESQHLRLGPAAVREIFEDRLSALLGDSTGETSS
ncbi:MAG: GntR family transcriptional regulator [bacterium]